MEPATPAGLLARSVAQPHLNVKDAARRYAVGLRPILDVEPPRLHARSEAAAGQPTRCPLPGQQAPAISEAAMALHTTYPRFVDLDMLRCAQCGEPLTAGRAGELAHSDGTALCRGRNGQPAEPVEQ